MTHAGPRHIANPVAPTKHAAQGRRVPWLRIIGGVAMLVALASVLGTGAFAAGLRVVGPWSAAAALALGLFSTVCTALRWRLIAQRVGLRLDVAEAVAESYRAVFLNSVLPGGVLGDVDRARRHGREAGDVGRSTRVVVLERTAGQLVLIARCAAGAAHAPGPDPVAAGRGADQADRARGCRPGGHRRHGVRPAARPPQRSAGAVARRRRQGHRRSPLRCAGPGRVAGHPAAVRGRTRGLPGLVPRRGVRRGHHRLGVGAAAAPAAGPHGDGPADQRRRLGPARGCRRRVVLDGGPHRPARRHRRRRVRRPRAHREPSRRVRRADGPPPHDRPPTVRPRSHPAQPPGHRAAGLPPPLPRRRVARTSHPAHGAPAPPRRGAPCLPDLARCPRRQRSARRGARPDRCVRAADSTRARSRRAGYRARRRADDPHSPPRPSRRPRRAPRPSEPNGDSPPERDSAVPRDGDSRTETATRVPRSATRRAESPTRRRIVRLAVGKVGTRRRGSDDSPSGTKTRRATNRRLAKCDSGSPG